jgi:hypothetical protein
MAFLQEYDMDLLAVSGLWETLQLRRDRYSGGRARIDYVIPYRRIVFSVKLRDDGAMYNTRNFLSDVLFL